MLLFKLQTFVSRAVRPSNLLRLGLLSFLLTVLYFKLPVSVAEVSQPPTAQAVTCTDGKCEAAGHCWSVGSKANGPDGCQYTCSGGSWGGKTNCSAERKAEHDKDYNTYQQQQSGSSGSSTGGTTTAPAAANTCGAGSASGCAGKSFYSAPTGVPSYVCFPNGIGSAGQTLCGRAPAGEVNPVTDPVTGKPVAGNIVNTNQANGGCALVVQCGCASGMQQLCLRDENMLAGSKASEYCARTVCSPIGTGGKVCTPGQVSECNGTLGKFCNADGKGWTWVRAHACGATHTVAYCSQTETIAGGQHCTDSATRYNSFDQCKTALCGANATTCSACVKGVTQIAPTQSYSSVQDYCIKNFSSTASIAYQDCMAKYSGANGLAVLQANTGACLPGMTFRKFAGCGSGTQAKWNCYTTCTNGVTGRSCANEPGLSCGAHESSVVAQQIATLETRFTTSTTPTSPRPSPQPTPTPTATCGQPCGAAAGGAYCTGSNQACVSGTCRSTLCSVSEQNSQCICQTPPPEVAICVDIYASKTDIKIGDQVSFTCAAVNNAVRYEFRHTYLTTLQGVAGAVMQDLAPSTATSRTSVPITVDKVGRYIAQCRPCAANNLCGEWEPIDGQIGAPTLEPAASPSPSPTPDTTDEESTESAST